VTEPALLDLPISQKVLTMTLLGRETNLAASLLFYCPITIHKFIQRDDLQGVYDEEKSTNDFAWGDSFARDGDV
jgi:hypothetical protein